MNEEDWQVEIDHLRREISRLRQHLSDANLALGVHSGKWPMHGTTPEEQAAITRALNRLGGT